MSKNRVGIKRKFANWLSYGPAIKQGKHNHHMSHFWDGIVDASVEVPYIWLSREKDTDEWKPLRKEDCRALNNIPDGEQEVIIDSGRATANIETLTINFNFFNYPPKKLCKANWFLVKNTKGPYLEPVLPLEDGLKIEAFYKEMLKSSSTLATGKDKQIATEILLDPAGEFKVVLSRSSDSISIRKKYAQGFGAMLDKGKLLQRGYGYYKIKGEDIELSLGPVKHLIFAVHGVGETIWSSSQNEMPSMKDELNRLRLTMQQKQYDEWKLACDRHKQKKSTDPPPPPPNRIEVIPIEWYDHIHSSSTSLMSSVNKATLNTVPPLRSVANDIVFDVLMYMTPEFCEATLECVTTQINEKYAKFKRIHPNFEESEEGDGKTSIIGHSLGSVIVWDLLSVRKLNLEENKMSEVKEEGTPVSGFSVFSVDRDGEFHDDSSDEENLNNIPKRLGRWLPSLPKKMTTYIDFEPEFTFFLGSPLGLMLTLRGAHEEFEDMAAFKQIEKANESNKDGKKVNEKDKADSKVTSDDKPIDEQKSSDKILTEEKTELENENSMEKESSPGKKPTPEEKLPPSEKTTPEKKSPQSEKTTPEKKSPPSGKSASEKTVSTNKLNTADIISPFALPTKRLFNIFHPSDPVAYRIEPLLLPRDLQKDDIPNQAVLATGNKGVRLHIKAKQLQRSFDSWLGGKKTASERDLNKTNSNEATRRSSVNLRVEKDLDFPLGGQNKRVDFELQVGLIDNEYFSALSAHTGYWAHDDMIDFVIETASMK